jgi:uncharacterized protein YndB with AHSA1/START domain
MTRQSSFKRLVRARMEKTGERYAAARAVLLAGRPPADDGPPAADPPVLATSDDAIRERTGRGWEEWFDALDAWGAADRTHRETARWVATQLDIHPLGWNAQAITMSYERARQGRPVGQRHDGFATTVSKTVPVAVERLFDAFADPHERAAWLDDDRLRERTARRPVSARYDWGDDGSRVHVTFAAKGDAKATIAVDHGRLADADAVAAVRAQWRERLGRLADYVTAGRRT